MDRLERLLPTALVATRGLGAERDRGALVHASLSSAVAIGRRGRHLTGTFCLTGDTMEGIIQCLVFLKAFSVLTPLFLEYGTSEKQFSLSAH